MPTRGSSLRHAGCRRSASRRCSRSPRAAAAVLMLRSVEFARNHHVPLHVRSSFTWEPGTWVTEEDAKMEQAVVTAVAHDDTEAKVTVTGVPDHPGVAARIFRALADRSVNVDMIVQNTSVHGTTDISFTVPGVDLQTSLEVARGLAPEIGAGEVLADERIAKIALDRRRNAEPPGHLGDDVRDPRRRGHQHRDDLHLSDPDLVRRALRSGRAGRSRPASGL